jgi:hypothetical protein
MAEHTFTSTSQSSKQRLLWIIFAILLFLIAGVWWYRSGRGQTALPSPQELGAIDQRFKELIELVETLQRITLDTSILQDTRFSSLERIPFSAEVAPEESGRANPFAPFPK